MVKVVIKRVIMMDRFYYWRGYKSNLRTHLFLFSSASTTPVSFAPSILTCRASLSSFCSVRALILNVCCCCYRCCCYCYVVIMRRMGRPSIDFEPWKDFVQALLETPRTWAGITECVTREMGQKVGERTLRRQCATWGFKRKPSIDRSQLVLLFIEDRFRNTRDSDREIARLLELAGVVITAEHVAIVRIENGLFRREQNLEDQQARQQAVIEAMRTAYSEGSVREYGREMMAAHLRRNGVVATRYKPLLL